MGKAVIEFDNCMLIRGRVDNSLLADVLDALPDDTKIINIGNMWNSDVGLITVEHDSFRPVPEATQYPKIIPIFEKDEDGSHLVNLDMSEALFAYNIPIKTDDKLSFTKWNIISTPQGTSTIYDDFLKIYKNIDLMSQPMILVPQQYNKPNNVFIPTTSSMMAYPAGTVGPTATTIVYEIKPGIYKFEDQSQNPKTGIRFIEGDFNHVLNAAQKLNLTITFKYLKDEKNSINLNNQSSICDHVWKNYVGLTQVYDFCTKCDAKKNN